LKKKLFETCKTILIAVGAGSVIILLFSWIDSTSDGSVLDYISKKFSYENSYIDGSGIHHVSQVLDWSAIKLAVICVLVVLTAVIIIVFRFSAGRREARLQEELKHKEWEIDLDSQKKNDLITYLAHDLRTPLTSVIGYLSLLNDAPDMPENKRADYTKICLDKAFRLESLINEFFDITRYNLQEIELSKEEVNLSYLLTQLTEEFYPILQQKQLSVRLNDPGEVMISADPEKLARVFNNILKNAAAYSSPGTEIMIDMEQHNDAAEITITNHGKTIPKEKLARIFDKFYRLDDARSSYNGGAGLGLAIAKKIVTLHNGKISVRSENGLTAFSVILPAGVPISAPALTK
jgi:two-component system sensor histidine kinase VanS